MRNPFQQVNDYNRVLALESNVLQEVMRRGLLRTALLDMSSSNDAPVSQVYLEVFESISLAAAPFPTVLEVPVIDFFLEKGFDAVLTRYTTLYIGATGGQVDGDGQLTWNLLIDGRYVQNLAPIINQTGLSAAGLSGSTQGPGFQIPRGIPVFSGQRVTMTVQVIPAGLTTAGCRVMCGVAGVKIPTSRG